MNATYQQDRKKQTHQRELGVVVRTPRNCECGTVLATSVVSSCCQRDGVEIDAFKVLSRRARGDWSCSRNQQKRQITETATNDTRTTRKGREEKNMFTHTS